jgi:hypothetical protein
MKALSLMLRQIDRGWAVTLSDGREVIRFTGFGAKRRALRWLRLAVRPDGPGSERLRGPRREGRLTSLARAIPTARARA